MNRPLKRHPALQPLSKEHHQILLLGFKIRQGLKNTIEPKRILSYSDWFFSAYLKPHFKKEEYHLTHVSGENLDIISQLKLNHQKVTKAFLKLTPSNSELKRLEELIISHVRYEERVLFEEIQSKMTQEDILYLENHLEEQKFQEHLQDVFWQ